MVDRLTKQALFILIIRSLDATMLAELFIKHIFSKYGVPSYVIFDQGTEFVSKFFRFLANTLDMRLHFTSGYHPEADGQTKCTNQTLEQFLRIYYNYQQSDWSQLLPLAEFVYNNMPSSTTGVSPFYANKGYHPKMQLQVENNTQIMDADLFVTDLRLVHNNLKRAIEDTQCCYQIPADKRRTPAPKIEVGDHVFILARFIKSTWPTKKLSEKYLGPFEVIKKLGTHSYLIKLPNHLCAIYPVFCKGTSKVVLSEFWGSVLLMAQWQIVYRTPIVPDSSCLCHVVRCLLLVVLEHSVIIGQLPWCCVPDYLV